MWKAMERYRKEDMERLERNRKEDMERWERNRKEDKQILGQLIREFKEDVEKMKESLSEKCEEKEHGMEEIGTEASNLVYLNTKQVEQLSDGDKADGTRCMVGQTGGRFSSDIVSICDAVKDEEEEEGDPFSPTGSETMEEPKNLTTRERRVSDVIDSIGDSSPYTDDHRIVSAPEKTTGTRGPDSPVSLGYGSVESGTPKLSVSPDSDADPSSPKKLLKMQQVDVTDACPMSQDNDRSPSEAKVAVMPVEIYAEEYNMNHNRRGKAVIFNHDEFKNKTPRHGFDVDVHVLKETYKSLDFEVICHNNLKFIDIQNAITNLANDAKLPLEKDREGDLKPGTATRNRANPSDSFAKDQESNRDRRCEGGNWENRRGRYDKQGSLQYRSNEFLIAVVTVVIIGLLKHFRFPATIIVDKYIQFVVNGLLCGIAIAILLCIRGGRAHTMTQNPFSMTGSHVYNFWMSREANLHIGPLNVKVRLYVVGMVGMMLANAALVLKSVEQNHGYSPTLIPTAGLQSWREIPVKWWDIIAVINAISHVTYRHSNLQKSEYRRMPLNPALRLMQE
jgi:hypothetical protein